MDEKKLIRDDIINRTPISKVVPLDTPFRLGIDPSNACNFKCAFCFHSLKDSVLSNLGHFPVSMKLETFQLLSTQINAFPSKFKSITFGGIGEPLLNRNLPQMVEMIKLLKKSDKISIVSNGAMLTPKLGKDLIKAGLDEIIISVEALSSEDYLSVTKCKVDFESFVENIEYFFKHKRHCKIFCKGVDLAINTPEKTDLFHKTFGGISDLAYIESIIPRYKYVDYKGMTLQNNLHHRHQMKAEICSLPLYSLSVSATGNVIPCCVDYGETIVLGNINHETLLEIWNGNNLKNLRLGLLEKTCDFEVCQNCKFTEHNGRIEDIIDNYAEDIIYKLNHR